jgi:hypothetical protein
MKKIVLLLVLSSVLSCKTGSSVVSRDNSNPTKYMKTITPEDLKKHLYIIAADSMEGRETGSVGQKKAGKYLISEYQKNQVSFPKGATNYYQSIPAAYLNKKYGGNLNDSENIWAFVEGTEKLDEIIVISAHYDHVGIKDGEV